jgi:hypothetical protein
MEAELAGAGYRQLMAAMRRSLEERLLRRKIEVGQEEADGL